MSSRLFPPRPLQSQRRQCTAVFRALLIMRKLINQFSASSIVYLDHPSVEGIFHLRVNFTATFDTRNEFVFILKVPLSPILPGTVHEDAGKQNLNRWLVFVSLQGIILTGLFVEAGTLENLVLKYIWEFICFYLVLNSNTHTTSCSMPEIPGWSIKNKLNIWRLQEMYEQEGPGSRLNVMIIDCKRDGRLHSHLRSRGPHPGSGATEFLPKPEQGSPATHRITNHNHFQNIYLTCTLSF